MARSLSGQVKTITDKGCRATVGWLDEITVRVLRNTAAKNKKFLQTLKRELKQREGLQKQRSDISISALIPNGQGPD